MAKAIVFLALTLPLMPVQALLLRFHKPASRALPHAYHKLVCRILRVDVEIDGEAPRSGLIVANHVSWLDIPVLSAAAKVSFVAKKEVASWPFFGTLARLQRSAFVNRERRHSTGESHDELSQRLNAGDVLVLFPEGTSHNGRLLKTFKSSFFGAAEKTGVPVVPVALVYQSRHGLPLTLRERPGVAWYGDVTMLPHLWGVLKGGPIRVKVIFSPAFFPAAFAGRKALSMAAETTIRQALAENLHQRPKMG